MITDWDDAYANGAHILDAADFPPRWAAEAQTFRSAISGRAELDLRYGEGERNVIDLFRPEGRPLGLVVFVHGGYWRAFDKNTWSHLAAGAMARGWAVAIPSYTLAPTARIHEITAEIARSIVFAASKVEGPIRLTGHSAGGHLVTRMAVQDGPLEGAVADRIDRIVSISGLHDLRPLLKTALNADLQLDEAEAIAESPALSRPRRGGRIVCWVGAAERPEFVRQNALLGNIWRGLGAETSVHEAPGEHHFNVIDGLSKADAPLTAALC